MDSGDPESADWYSESTATFGDRLAGAREALDLSGEDLSRRLGVKLKTLQNWENDVSEPRANRLQMLSGILNVSIPWLLTGEGDGPEAPDPELPEEMAELLAEIREQRARIAVAADRLGVLEKRLRTLSRRGWQ